MENRSKHNYLGDGVYLETLNGAFILRIGSHDNDAVRIHVEPFVAANMIREFLSGGVQIEPREQTSPEYRYASSYSGTYASALRAAIDAALADPWHKWVR